MFSPFQERQARMRQQLRKAKALGGAPQNKMLGSAPEEKAQHPIDFASDEAAEAAEAAGLRPTDFAGVKASGKNGYTVADVRALAKD